MKKNDSKYTPTTQHNPCPTRDYCKRLQKSFNEAQSELADRRQRITELEAAAADALSGWRYIRQNHGDLYGVGWDRVEGKLSKALEGKQ